MQLQQNQNEVARRANLSRRKGRAHRRSDGLGAVASLRHHWPEYVIEVGESGCCLFAGCIFTALLPALCVNCAAFGFRQASLSLYLKMIGLDEARNIYHNLVLMIGEFEYLILGSVARLGEDAYGASIRNEIENATGRHCSIGALYTTLDRLEGKGHLKTWMGEPTPQRGGRSKRHVRITASGAKAATDFFKAVSRISQGVSWATDRPTTR